MALTKIDDRGLKTPIELLDNEKIRLGTGNDLEIYHDGSDSYIDDSGTGDLCLRSSTTYLQKYTGENCAKFVADGAVELYYDNTKRFETLSTGAAVTGELDVSGHIDLNSDSHRLKIGAGDDLQIYHDGTNNYIYTNNGDLNLQTEGDDVQITAADDINLNVQGNEAAIKCIGNGQVELYFDNSKKLETTTNGIKVNNRVEFINQAIVDNAANGNDIGIYFGSSGILPAVGSGGLTNASKDLGSSSYKFRNVYATTLYGDGSNLTGINTDLVSDTSPQLGGDLDLNGSIISVGDGGPNANQEHIRFGNDGDLRIWHDGSDSYIKDTGTGFLVIESNQLQVKNDAADEKMIVADANGSVELYHNNSKKFESTSSGVEVFGQLQMDDANSHIKLVDSARIDIGSSDDLKIYHHSNDNIIDSVTSNLYIRKNGSNSVVLDGNGDIYIPDNRITYWGDSADLQIWHNGSSGNTNIKQSTGDMYFYTGNDLNLHLKDGTSTDLYYANAKKLETTSTGITVSGMTLTTNPRAAYYGVNNASGASGWKILQWRVQETASYISNSNSISRFTPSRAGWYLCIFNHRHESGDHSDYHLRIQKNSNTTYTHVEPSGSYLGHCAASIYFDGSSDYVEFSTYHSNSSHACHNSNYTNMRMHYLTNT